MNNLLLTIVRNGCLMKSNMAAVSSTTIRMIQSTSEATSSSLQSGGLIDSVKFFSTKKPSDSHVARELIDEADLLNRKNTNPFALYVRQNFQAMKQKNPGVKNSVQITTLANEWKSMSAEQKLSYFEEAKKNRKERDDALHNLFAKLSVKEAEELKGALVNKKLEKKKSLENWRLKKEKKLLKKPKKPASAFLIFKSSLDAGEGPVTEVSKGAAQRWRAMPEQEKTKFFDEYTKRFQQYQEELTAWEGKMIADGKVKLVRDQVKRNLAKVSKEIKSKGSKKRKTVSLKALKAKAKAKQQAIKKLDQREKQKKNTLKKLSTEIKRAQVKKTKMKTSTAA